MSEKIYFKPGKSTSYSGRVAITQPSPLSTEAVKAVVKPGMIEVTKDFGQERPRVKGKDFAK